MKILKLIDLKMSLHQIEARLGISRKTLREWNNKENLLKDQNKKEKRFRCDLKYSIKRSLSEDDEAMIKNWIIDCRNYFAPLSTKSLVCYAGNLNTEFKDKCLKVRYRWAYRYLKRNGFSIRRVSHQGN